MIVFLTFLLQILFLLKAITFPFEKDELKEADDQLLVVIWVVVGVSALVTFLAWRF